MERSTRFSVKSGPCFSESLKCTKSVNGSYRKSHRNRYFHARNSGYQSSNHRAAESFLNCGASSSWQRREWSSWNKIARRVGRLPNSTGKDIIYSCISGSRGPKMCTPTAIWSALSCILETRKSISRSTDGCQPIWRPIT